MASATIPSEQQHSSKCAGEKQARLQSLLLNPQLLIGDLPADLEEPLWPREFLPLTC
jgi:hypothetical protein